MMSYFWNETRIVFWQKGVLIHFWIPQIGYLDDMSYVVRIMEERWNRTIRFEMNFLQNEPDLQACLLLEMVKFKMKCLRRVGFF